MNHETRQKWQRLFELRNAEETELDGLWFDEQREIDALAAELEKWAHTADAGALLDLVCATWRSGDRAWIADPPLVLSEHARTSTCPSRAMELLVAMHGELLCTDGSEGTTPEVFVPARPHPRDEHTHDDGRIYTDGEGPGTECLAIARAAAVLAARGIPPEKP